MRRATSILRLEVTLTGSYPRDKPSPGTALSRSVATVYFPSSSTVTQDPEHFSAAWCLLLVWSAPAIYFSLSRSLACWYSGSSHSSRLATSCNFTISSGQLLDEGWSVRTEVICSTLISSLSSQHGRNLVPRVSHLIAPIAPGGGKMRDPGNEIEHGPLSLLW